MIVSNFPYIGDIKNQIETHNLDNNSHPDIREQLESLSDGYHTEPLNLTGFQPDSTGVNVLHLTDEQYASVEEFFNNGAPISIDSQIILYPSTKNNLNIMFASTQGLDMTYVVIVNSATKTANLCAILDFYEITINDLNVPQPYIQSTLPEILFTYGYVHCTYDGVMNALDANSILNSTTYIFTNSDYRLTLDTQANTATLSLIDTVTEAEMTKVISTANNEVLTESKSYTDQKITGGITDIGVGAPLASGTIYIVYE